MHSCASCACHLDESQDGRLVQHRVRTWPRGCHTSWWQRHWHTNRSAGGGGGGVDPRPTSGAPPRGLLMRHLPAAGAAIILRSLIGVDEDQQHACMDDICIDRYK